MGEISNMVKEAKADVEAAVGGDIACAIPINNHVSRVDVYGKDRLMSGREMVSVMHDIVCAEDLGPEPFQPAEVDYVTVVKYVEEELEKHPHLKKRCPPSDRLAVRPSPWQEAALRNSLNFIRSLGVQIRSFEHHVCVRVVSLRRTILNTTCVNLCVFILSWRLHDCFVTSSGAITVRDSRSRP